MDVAWEARNKHQSEAVHSQGSESYRFLNLAPGIVALVLSPPGTRSLPGAFFMLAFSQSIAIAFNAI